MKEKFTIVISGASGSGKTETVNQLAQKLNGSTLFFDDYSKDLVEKQSKKSEAKNEIKLSNYELPSMARDLKKLLQGKTIINPRTKQEIKTSNFIVIEDPHGRGRKDINQLYDFVVLLDIPLEICLARVILRTFQGEMILLDRGFIQQSEASAKEKLELLEKYIFGPYFTRDSYIDVNNQVKENVDLIIDEVRPLESILNEILEKVLSLKKSKKI